MKTVECPNLCDGCPIRRLFDEDGEQPTVISEVNYSAKGNISKDGRTASIELRYGMLVDSDRFSTLVIESENQATTYTFGASGNAWDSGQVEQAFEDCEAPTESRGGIFHLQKTVGCTALRTIQSL
jgi:hypothetical protein